MQKKTCTKCGKERELIKFNKDIRGKYGKTSVCKSCLKEYDLQRRLNDPDFNKRQVTYKAKIRREVMAHYGIRCVCCGEETYEFLTFDHINNDGAKHRNGLATDGNGRNYSSIQYWIKNNNYPDTIQILCYNCNSASHHYGKCPHKKS